MKRTHLILGMLIFAASLLIAPKSSIAQISEANKSQARLYGLHMIDLKPGVTAQEFEDFFANRYLPKWKVPGWSVRLLKGDRGDRTGRYLVMYEAERVELRDQLAPESNVLSEEYYNEYFKPLEEVAEEWKKLALYPSETTIYTDYYVVAGN